MPLEPEDLAHLTAAEGYVDLGMHLDANEELEQIDPDVRHVPEVLEQRVRIYFALKKWELLYTVASRLVEFNPDEPSWRVSLAYATRRTESIVAAKDVLIEGLSRTPEIAVFHYNLACYECQLGNIEAAKEHLSKAFTLDKGFRQIALEDADLEPLWKV